MALLALIEDEQRILFTQLCNVLDPRGAVDFSSTNSGLWVLMQALRQQLRTDHEVAAALCLKLGMRSCKELREAKEVKWINRGLSATDLGLLGTLGSVLPALEELRLFDSPGGAAGPDGVQRLAAGLGAGALPAVFNLTIFNMHVGEAGASALAAALDRGALPRLKSLALANATITDAGLVALAPALRRRPALENLFLMANPLGDEGLAALVAPPPAGHLKISSILTRRPAVLAKLKMLDLRHTQITDAGCAALAAALNSGALPALDIKGREHLSLDGIPASAAAQRAVLEALANRSQNTVRLELRVPDGANVGDRLTFNTAAGQFSLVLPAGAAPGKMMIVTMPVPANFPTNPQQLVIVSGLHINGQLP